MASRIKVGSKVFLRGTAVVFLLLLAWRVWSLGLADAKSKSAPDEALQWRPQHSAALSLLAEQQAQQAETRAEAKQNALAALKAYPLEGRAYRVLGSIAEAEKNSGQALRFYQSAVHATPRDMQSHAWLLNHAIGKQNAASAVEHLDFLLRLQPELLSQLAPTVGAMAATPFTQTALIAGLQKNPPWRLPVIQALAAHSGAADHYAVFFYKLGQMAPGLTENEQAAWLRALNQGRQWSLAYLSWANQLPIERQLELGNVFNGSFEHQPLEAEFDWRFDRVIGANIGLAAREGADGKLALRIQFDGGRVAFSSVRQTLVLPGAHYRLSGKGWAEDLRNERGLVWSVHCMGSGAVLAESQPWKGRSGGWHAFSVDFEVPDENCPAQWLLLKLPARVASEEVIGGIIWFDALKIQRLPGRPGES